MDQLHRYFLCFGDSGSATPSEGFLTSFGFDVQTKPCHSEAFRHNFHSLNIPILSRKPVRMGLQPKHKNFNKTLLFCVCKSFSRYKDKDCMKDVTVIRSIPVLHAEKFVPTLFSPVAFTLRKLVDT